MTDREATEKLVERGTWVDGYQASRLTQTDGVIVDFVEIDPRLKPKKKRVWMFFAKNQRWSSREFDEHMAQRYIATSPIGGFVERNDDVALRSTWLESGGCLHDGR